MNPWVRWSLKLLMVLLALSGFAAGADQNPGLGRERGLPAEPASAGVAWQSLSQAINPPLAVAAWLLDCASAGGAPDPARMHQLGDADEATQPCESSAGLLLIACLLAQALRRRRACRPA